MEMELFLLFQPGKLIAPDIKGDYEVLFLNPTNIVLVNGQVWLSVRQALGEYFP